MRRRDWLLVVGSGLLVSWLPACSGRPLASQAGGPVRPDAKLGMPEELPAQVAAARSPYHVLPLGTATGDEGPTAHQDPSVEPVHYPAMETRRDGLLTPPGETQGPATNVVDLQPAAKPIEESPLIQVLRCFQEKRPTDAMQRLAGFDKPNQEMLFVLMPLAVRLTEGSLAQANPQETTMIVDQLEGLIGPLRKRAALTIEKICFCRVIRGFGDYEPLPDDHCFHPGDLAQVYVQLRNFSCEHQDGAYVMRLASVVEMRDFYGNRMLRQDFPARSDYSREQRHDYFSNYRFLKIPDTPGLYTLTIRVIDQPDTPRQRTAERSLDFRVTTRNRME